MVAVVQPTIERFREVRGRSVALAAPLAVDDLLAQSMDDVSPTKWHLAHTTWYFERFVLARTDGFAPVDPRHDFLFNSYYDAVGPRHPRPRRSLITRPTLDDVWAYRRAIDAAMERLLEAGVDDELAFVIEVGLAHEEQHQELILTDIKHVLGTSLFQAAYRPAPAESAAASAPGPASAGWRAFAEGIHEIGHDGRGFAFDNEGPRHRVFLEAFEIAARTITCGELCEFIADGGYETPSLWVAEGWARVQAEGWGAPLYWEGGGDERWLYTLHGRQEVDPAAPACHLSWFEADAFARWAGARLPSEAEWEVACAAALADGDAATRAIHDAGAALLHPRPAGGGGLQQMLGSVWEWSASPYVAYPRSRPWAGALGEYNGKFMSSQVVLRGGSCFTPPGHTRPTYRNFFPPATRWQMSGARLARWI
ncbi:MAG: ergothioneine biosynthesis protein EgtB [Myxococcales bacterium]|nr:ergothioneine biosynthesis protein EgtB [Myxococcales bacterium]